MYNQQYQDLNYAAKTGNVSKEKNTKTPAILTHQFQSDYPYPSTQRKKTIDNPLDHVKKALSMDNTIENEELINMYKNIHEFIKSKKLYCNNCQVRNALKNLKRILKSKKIYVGDIKNIKGECHVDGKFIEECHETPSPSKTNPTHNGYNGYNAVDAVAGFFGGKKSRKLKLRKLKSRKLKSRKLKSRKLKSRKLKLRKLKSRK